MTKIVGVAELAEMLGVTRQRAWQLTKTADFPAPCYQMKAGDFWKLSDVQAWAKRNGRTTR